MKEKEVKASKMIQNVDLSNDMNEIIIDELEKRLMVCGIKEKTIKRINTLFMLINLAKVTKNNCKIIIDYRA